MQATRSTTKNKIFFFRKSYILGGKIFEISFVDLKKYAMFASFKSVLDRLVDPNRSGGKITRILRNAKKWVKKILLKIA